MNAVEIEEPISDTIADAILGIGNGSEDMLEEAFQSMIHSPLPWDVILLMGIYDYSKTNGWNLIQVTERNKLSIARQISEFPATMKEVLPGLTYMAQLHDGIEDNEELTTGVLKSLIYILWLVIYKITGEDRFDLGTLTIAVAMESSYRDHLNSTLQASASATLQS